MKKYPGNIKMCAYTTLLHYISRTKSLRNTKSLLIVTTGRGTAISGYTLCRWTKNVMAAAGIDLKIFKPYSTHSAAVSKSAQEGNSLTKVLAMGCWRTTSTFFHYYLRRIKYFTRHKNTGFQTASTRNTVKAQQVASPVQRKAAHALTKSLRKIRNVNRTIHVELPPHQQGLENVKDALHTSVSPGSEISRLDYKDHIPVIHPTLVNLSPSSTVDVLTNHNKSNQSLSPQKISSPSGNLPTISDVFSAPLPPPPVIVLDDQMSVNTPSEITIQESSLPTPIQGSSEIAPCEISPNVTSSLVTQETVTMIEENDIIGCDGKAAPNVTDEHVTSNPITSWELFPQLRQEQPKDVVSMFTTLPLIVHIVQGQHLHLPNLLPMREHSSEEKIHKTMYIEPLSVELQLNNSFTFLRKKTMVDIAIALRSNIVGNYVPYLYLNNLEDHENYLLCNHLSQKTLLGDIMDHVSEFVSFVASAQRLFIHAGGNNLFLVFLLPLHPKLLMHLAGRKDILLVAVNRTPCLVITVADFNALKSKV